jgi:hypothetical protein
MCGVTGTVSSARMIYGQLYSNSVMAAIQPEANADANIQEALAREFDHYESINLSSNDEKLGPKDFERTIDVIRTMLN